MNLSCEKIAKVTRPQESLLQSTSKETGPLSVALKTRERDGRAGAAEGKTLISGDGWRVVDVLCTCGPADRPFEERYWSVAVSLVLSGSFAYRTSLGSVLMSPGSWLLGNVGGTYECSHEHGHGDRCLSFQFDPALFDHVARDAGLSAARFGSNRIPPMRKVAPLAARAISALDGNDSFEEVALEAAATALRIGSDSGHCEQAVAPRDRTRIVDVLHHLEHDASRVRRLEDLSKLAGLSRYHFLRVFKAVTGVTPHQWLIRTRLREAARRLARGEEAVTDIALDVGFDDLSNFIRSFHSEFGMSPGFYRTARPALRTNGAKDSRSTAL